MPSAGNTSVKYAATITLQPKLYKYKPEEQYDKSYMHIAKQLMALGTKVDLVAELTKNYNIHYHLVIQFVNFKPKSNLMLMFHNAFRNDPIVGFVNIKQIEDEVKWLDYIMKDINITKETINRPPIILNEIHTKNNDVYIKGIPFMYQIDLIDDQ